MKSDICPLSIARRKKLQNTHSCMVARTFPAISTKLEKSSIVYCGFTTRLRFVINPQHTRSLGSYEPHRSLLRSSLSPILRLDPSDLAFLRLRRMFKITLTLTLKKDIIGMENIFHLRFFVHSELYTF